MGWVFKDCGMAGKDSLKTFPGWGRGSRTGWIRVSHTGQQMTGEGQLEVRGTGGYQVSQDGPGPEQLGPALG